MTGDILKIYNAYLSGAHTTAEVAKITGIKQERCSTYTIDLIKRGYLRKTDAIVRRVKTGRAGSYYEPIPKMKGKTKGADA